MGVKAELINIYDRPIQFDKKLGIIRNGVDNLYSERIERYINNSVTAKAASIIMSNYILGKGFGNSNDIVVGKDTLFRFSTKILRNLVKHRGVFIHINYNANYKINSFDVLPYTHCRLGKKDDEKYNGKIAVSSKFSHKDLNINDISFFNVFNPNEKVVKSQVENEGGWSQYKGQILFYNLDFEFDYPLSTIDAVKYDCDSEHQASLYKNTSLRNGFFGKTIVVTEQLVDDFENYQNDEKGAELYLQDKSDAEKFNDSIKSFLGAENSAKVLHVQLDPKNPEATLEQAIRFESVSSNIDDKMFEYTENSSFRNILMAFNNLPSQLIRSENALFGNSGESIKQMRVTYQNNVNNERKEFLNLINLLFENYKDEVSLEHELLFNENELKNDTVNNEI